MTTETKNGGITVMDPQGQVPPRRGGDGPEARQA